jgi:hypothetical protein
VNRLDRLTRTARSLELAGRAVLAATRVWGTLLIVMLAFLFISGVLVPGMVSGPSSIGLPWYDATSLLGLVSVGVPRLRTKRAA